MSVILKNQLNQDVVYAGIPVPQLGQSDLTGRPTADLISDLDFIVSLDAGDIVVNDGTQDLYASTAKMFLANGGIIASAFLEYYNLTWASLEIRELDWIRIAETNSGTVGHIMPFNSTITRVVAHTVNIDESGLDIRLYINNSLVEVVGTLTGSGEQSFITNVSINADSGDKIRLRGGNNGQVDDTIINVWFKERN